MNENLFQYFWPVLYVKLKHATNVDKVGKYRQVPDRMFGSMLCDNLDVYWCINTRWDEMAQIVVIIGFAWLFKQKSKLLIPSMSTKIRRQEPLPSRFIQSGFSEKSVIYLHTNMYNPVLTSCVTFLDSLLSISPSVTPCKNPRWWFLLSQTCKTVSINLKKHLWVIEYSYKIQTII